MNQDLSITEKSYEMKFDIGTIKHLGLQMYSTLPPVIGELVANAWDANAPRVDITIPEGPIDPERSEIIIEDDGIGMSDKDVREKYLIIGRDRRQGQRAGERLDVTPKPDERKIMGRKGIGKFSAFGIAKEIDVESVHHGKTSHFLMNYDELLKKEKERIIELPQLPPTDTISNGTKITLRNITRFENRRISIETLRRGLARRFAVIGQKNFEVVINGKPITLEERDLKRKLARDEDGKKYLWKYPGIEIKKGTGWTVSGWIGALDRTSQDKDKIERGIALMARGKLVQEPFVFDATVGQQFALSYLIGELHVEFADEGEDTIATTRNSLVWDAEANAALKEWGEQEVNKIASLWAKRRREDNRSKLKKHPTYVRFQKQAGEIDKKREFKQADQLIQQLILKSLDKSLNADIEDFEPVVDMFIDFWKYDSFLEMAENIRDAGIEEPEKLFNLFREWEILEVKEMAKVTEGRIKTIEKLDEFIETNAKEVPTLHNFLKEFPWVIDSRWTLVADEHRYSDLLRDEFPDSDTIPEVNRRIDFLCVSEGTHLVVVEIKRPQSKVSMEALDQIEDYVNFVRNEIDKTTGPDRQYETATGYLLCGDLVDDYRVRGKRNNLEKAQIYVKRYGGLLETVRRSHTKILERYNQLQEKKKN